MSNAYAIAAVTATLRNLLDQGVKDLTTNVTVLPLDKAASASGTQLNLFLYQVGRNAAWTNRDMPRQVQPNEIALPPLPLDLYYLVTVFVSDNDLGKATDHTLLGQAMSVLHDHPVLSAQDVELATLGPVGPVPESDLHQQIERVRITQMPLSVDEMSKLWTGFATNYRLSAAYQVGVALIESTRATKTPLPVLTRGKDDSGINAEASVVSPLPTLESLTPPKQQASARLTDLITLTGVNLNGDDVLLRFEHPRLAAPIEAAPDSGDGTTITFTIPNAPADWPSGFYTVTALVQRSGEAFHRTTNQLVMALAPTLASVVAATASGTGTITVTTAPEVRLGQRPALLLGDREILAQPIADPPGQTDTLLFDLVDMPTDDYFVRLRVDGVDSLLVDKTKTPPKFDPSQKVTIT
jgi:hypothetical protein